MIQLFGLIDRFTGEVDVELFDDFDIDLAQYDRRMHFAAGKSAKAIYRAARVGVGICADGERYQYLVKVQSGI